MSADFYTDKYSFRRMEYPEIKELEVGDEIAVCTYMDIPYWIEFVKATVVRPLFRNNNTDESDWKVETTNGFVDIYSIYKVEER